jgi:hypothetical protein
VFARGEWYWVHGDRRPRPPSLDQVWDDELVQECGTHSILDIFDIAPGPPDPQEHVMSSVVVTDEEAVRIFGTGRPTAADLERLGGPSSRALDELLIGRGVGRHLTVYAHNTPDQLLFFGYSGD